MGFHQLFLAAYVETMKLEEKGICSLPSDLWHSEVGKETSRAAPGNVPAEPILNERQAGVPVERS